MYRHVVVVRPGGWYEKVNGVEITWNTCAKPPIIIAYAYSIFFSGVSSLKKKVSPYLSADPSTTCLSQFTEKKRHQGMLLRIRLVYAHHSLGNVVQ